jgi:membrane-associated protein
MHLAGFASGLLDPQSLISSAGPWGLAIVCALVFVETGLLIGFVLPGDTLLFFTGLLTYTGAIGMPVWLVIVCVSIAAIAGDQLGYAIGRAGGPRVFERKESGLFSKDSVRKTERFFERFGPASVTLARFVPVVRTFAPVAAGIARMSYGKFFLFNVVGAVAWSTLAILVGFLVGHIPGVSNFVSSYIDIVLVGIVVVSAAPVVIRSLIARRRASNATDEHAEQHSGPDDFVGQQPTTERQPSTTDGNPRTKEDQPRRTDNPRPSENDLRRAEGDALPVGPRDRA